MKFLIILFIISSSDLQAIEYIQSWKKIKKENLNIKETIIKNKCTKIEKQLKLFSQKNIKNEKDSYYYIQNCNQEKTFSDDELNIKRWTEINIDTGFILSNELDSRGCKSIYTKQIPHFHKKNNLKPRDVDWFKIGETYQIQTCKVEESIPVVIPILSDTDLGITGWVSIDKNKPIDQNILDNECKNLDKQLIRFNQKNEKLEEQLVQSCVIKKVEKPTEKSFFSITNNRENTGSLFGVGLNYRSRFADLKVNNVSRSLVTRASVKYNLLNDSLTIFNDFGIKASTKNQDRVFNFFDNVGFTLNLFKGYFKIGISQSIMAKKNSISGFAELAFTENFGMYLESLKIESINKDEKVEHQNYWHFFISNLFIFI